MKNIFFFYAALTYSPNSNLLTHLLTLHLQVCPSIKISLKKEIRIIWDSDKEDYYFSVVDVIAALTDSPRPRNYWSDLKRKLKQKGSELHEKIVQFKMKTKDGKIRETDTLDTEGIFTLIESVPSPKAEPFKI